MRSIVCFISSVPKFFGEMISHSAIWTVFLFFFIARVVNFLCVSNTLAVLSVDSQCSLQRLNSSVNLLYINVSVSSFSGLTLRAVIKVSFEGGSEHNNNAEVWLSLISSSMAESLSVSSNIFIMWFTMLPPSANFVLYNLRYKYNLLERFDIVVFKEFQVSLAFCKFFSWTIWLSSVLKFIMAIAFPSFLYQSVIIGIKKFQ